MMVCFVSLGISSPEFWRVCIIGGLGHALTGSDVFVFPDLPAFAFTTEKDTDLEPDVLFSQIRSLNRNLGCQLSFFIVRSPPFRVAVERMSNKPDVPFPH
jgi:hypothetical protein